MLSAGCPGAVLCAGCVVPCRECRVQSARVSRSCSCRHAAKVLAVVWGVTLGRRWIPDSREAAHICRSLGLRVPAAAWLAAASSGAGPRHLVDAGGFPSATTLPYARSARTRDAGSSRTPPRDSTVPRLQNPSTDRRICDRLGRMTRQSMRRSSSSSRPKAATPLNPHIVSRPCRRTVATTVPAAPRTEHSARHPALSTAPSTQHSARHPARGTEHTALLIISTS